MVELQRVIRPGSEANAEVGTVRSRSILVVACRVVGYERGKRTVTSSEKQYSHLEIEEDH